MSRAPRLRAPTLGLLLLATGCASSPPIPTEPPPTEPIRALVAFLREVHPNPHRFLGEAELDARLETEVDALGPSPDGLALARGASRVLAGVADAHLAVGLGPEVTEGPLLPFLLKRAGDRVFLDASEPPMPLGTEVLEVEGRPVHAFLEALSELASVDGDRPGVRLAEAERRLAFLGSMELGPRTHYELSVRRPDAAPEVLRLMATDREGLGRLARARRSAPVWGAPTADEEPWWPTLERLDDTTQLLRLASFGSYDEERFETRIAALFESVRATDRLVLDLRGNEGGNRALGIAVSRRLLDRPFAQWTRVSTRVRAIPEGFRELVTFPIAPESALRDFPGERRGEWWVVEGDPLADRMVPVEDPHRGPVVAFVDDATSSAAVELLAGLLAHRDDVVVIGTETQGACDRHTGQLPVLFQSGELAVFVSLFEIELVPIPGCEPGRGIVPDVEVVYREEDFLEGRDPYRTALGL